MREEERAREEARLWEERIQRMRRYIRRAVRNAGLRDGEQCVLECELALWRGQSGFNPRQEWDPWAKTIIKNAIYDHRLHESRWVANESPLGGMGLWGEADDSLESWLLENTVSGEWIAEGPEETVVLRVSIDAFLDMLAEQYHANRQMLMAALALMDWKKLGDLELILGKNGKRADDRKVKQVVYVNLRSALLRFFEGEYPLT